MRNFFLWELLFPTKCIFCLKITSDHRAQICPQCRNALIDAVTYHKKIPFSSGWTALWSYEGAVRNSLLRYKFRRKRHYCRIYGEELAALLLNKQISFDLITWVPISTRRKLKRGYDQCELLSRVLENRTGIPAVRCLRKTKHTPPQSTLQGEAQRKANVLGVYQPVRPTVFAGKTVLLLDDIITTGATISECAKTLMLAGAKEVYCAAIASAAKNHK
jgi:ComF family protein